MPAVATGAVAGQVDNGAFAVGENVPLVQGFGTADAPESARVNVRFVAALVKLPVCWSGMNSCPPGSTSSNSTPRSTTAEALVS